MKSDFDYHSYDERECNIHNHAFYLGEQHQQSKIDELTLQVAEMKSRLNDAYTDGQSAMYTARQSKIDELQKRVDAVNLVLEGLKNANYMHYENKAYNSLLIEKLEQALKGGD